MSETSKRINRQAELLEFDREATKVDQAFYQLPTWRQNQLEGDNKQSNFDMERSEEV